MFSHLSAVMKCLIEKWLAVIMPSISRGAKAAYIPRYLINYCLFFFSFRLCSGTLAVNPFPRKRLTRSSPR